MVVNRQSDFLFSTPLQIWHSERVNHELRQHQRRTSARIRRVSITESEIGAVKSESERYEREREWADERERKESHDRHERERLEARERHEKQEEEQDDWR